MTELLTRVLTIYPNTNRNAVRVGWAYLPDHCFGDHTKPLMAHDHVAGTFTYIDEHERRALVEARS